ncbi:hypothetical protein BDR26DRAFT_496926 [Obelidium mucronatum]|nr:hypothetical protein BDR26DRAFT_496926 [Obelidium mucronatum]
MDDTMDQDFQSILVENESSNTYINLDQSNDNSNRDANADDEDEEEEGGSPYGRPNILPLMKKTRLIIDRRQNELSKAPLQHGHEQQSLEYQQESIKQEDQPTLFPPPLPPLLQIELRHGTSFFRSFDGQTLTSELIESHVIQDVLSDPEAKIQDYMHRISLKLKEISSEIQKFSDFKTSIVNQLEQALQDERFALKSVTLKRDSAQVNARLLISGGGNAPSSELKASILTAATGCGEKTLTHD